MSSTPVVLHAKLNDKLRHKIKKTIRNEENGRKGHTFQSRTYM